MAGEVTFDDSEFQAGLRRALTSIRLATPETLERVGNRVVDEIQSRAPVLSGTLRASYTARASISAGIVSCVIASSALYAVFVEFGTIYMRAQPHVRPGLQAAGAAWVSEASKIQPRA